MMVVHQTMDPYDGGSSDHRSLWWWFTGPDMPQSPWFLVDLSRCSAWGNCNGHFKNQQLWSGKGGLLSKEVSD